MCEVFVVIRIQRPSANSFDPGDPAHDLANLDVPFLQIDFLALEVLIKGGFFMFQESGTQLFGGCGDNNVYAWDIETGQETVCFFYIFI